MPPQRNLDLIRNDMERLFQDFSQAMGEMLPEAKQRFSTLFAREAMGFYPKIDIREQNDQLIIHCDLPGLELKDIEVLTDRTSVTISGNVSREKNVREEDYFLSERNVGGFQRTIPLPKPIDSNQAHATFRNGVLTISAPIAEEAKRNYRSVPIES